MQVYATTGSDEKHEFLRALGVKFVTSSRNAAQFEEEMRAFPAESQAGGVDVDEEKPDFGTDAMEAATDD